jgi:hypothetical protein
MYNLNVGAIKGSNAIVTTENGINNNTDINVGTVPNNTDASNSNTELNGVDERNNSYIDNTGMLG